jgi:hypothetical protein
MPYSEGVAPYCDLFGPPDKPPDEAAEFLMPLLVNEVDKAFHWKPLTRERSDRLLERSGLAIDEAFSGYDRADYVPGESRVRLVVARASRRPSRDVR